MIFPHHALIGDAANIPVPEPRPVVSYSPLVLDTPDRRVPLQVRITAPATKSGDAPLPILLFSHGHGRSDWLSSQEGYAPVAEFWASRGFAVFQPTHLSSKALSLPLDGNSIRELFLESRIQDMRSLLDKLDTVEDSVPFLSRGQLDRTRVAVAGHSLGGLTATMLLGANNTDPRDGTKTIGGDPRITAGAVIGGTGNGGEDLSANGKTMIPFYGIDFSTMTTPTLVVWGDEDIGPHLTVRGADWHADPYTMAPAPKTSLSITGGKHGFGGISGWDAAETQDGSVERLAAVQRLTWAYLWSSLYKGDTAWDKACAALKGLEQLGRVESK
ncbi:hypothetical protein SBRCBS47491_001559 [Sporothrix bragantina]|uniref:AB hydrolase-1 domain-containing protein n=1 Tax=Sporothrix bragantina TaxID=671064 RepID=A0ABP0AZM3_9PEZI